MKKYLLVLLLTLITFVSACGTTNQQQAAGEPETITHNIEQNGLALKATIKIGQEIHVDASITNISGKTIIYNGRCGIPFGMSVKKEDAYAHLVTGDGKVEVCEEIFDPNDLREMKPNDTFEKKMTFKREHRLTNDRSVRALDGKYEVSFSFQTHESEKFYSTMPIELKNNGDPEVLTVEQAKEKAKEDKKAGQWFADHEKEGMSIESEEPILSDGMWTVAFHAIHENGADRIVINMDAKTGKIKAVHYEELGEDMLPFLKGW